MKRSPFAVFARVASALLPIAATLSVPALAAEPLPALDAYVCTASGSALNVRLAPSTDAAVVAQIPNDSQVWMVAPRIGNWLPIATSSARGYVWAAYICEPDMLAGAPDMDDDKPVINAMPARCSRDENVRNVRHPGGLDVYEEPDSESQVVAMLNDGAAIVIVPTPIGDADGSTWLPVSFPAEGYVMAAHNGVVNNIVYCTRFYN